MVVVVLPVSFVVGAVRVREYSFAICLAVFPESFVHGTVSVNHSSSTIGHIILPVSFENGAILDNLHATTESFTVGPLAFVLTTIRQLDDTLLRSKVIIFTRQFAILEFSHSCSFVENFLSHSIALILSQSTYLSMKHARFLLESMRLFDTVANKEAASYGLELDDSN